jgi:hypothetical protein
MEVSGQLHAPTALPTGKAPPVPIGQEAKRQGREADRLPPSNDEVKNGGAMPPLP